MKYFQLFFSLTILISCTHKYERNTMVFPSNTIEQESEQEYIKERDTSSFAKVKFDYYELDAGDVPSGPAVEFKFPFTNVGEYPLVISFFTSSSGCVVPICKKWFILPGESSVLEAKHLTKGMSGPSGKTLTMKANTSLEFTVLHLKVNIIATRNDND